MGHLERCVPNDERWEAVRRRVRDTDMLIVDEASMLSKKMFEQVNLQ